MWAQIVSALTGVWLMMASAVLGYGGAVRTNDRIVGPLVASCAIVAVSEVTRSVRLINFPLGLWLIVAPWVLQGSGWPAVLNSTAAGIVLIACACVRGKVNERFGGGWASLWKKPVSLRS